MQIAIVHKLDFNIRSSNGSTPYHSAAVCNSLSLSMFTLTDFKKKLTIPDLKYFNGRSNVEYGCSTLQSIVSSFFIEIAIDSKHNLYNTDTLGRNFLHYAASNENFYIFISLTKHLRHIASYLLHQRDAFGKTPVDVLFVSKPPQIRHNLNGRQVMYFSFILHLACLQLCRNTTHLSIS